MRYHILASALLCAGMLAAAPAKAAGPLPYGNPITLEQAQKIAAAARAEAAKNHWEEIIAIVEPNGQLVYYSKMDDAQYGSMKVALNKATSAALFRRPTKVFHDLLAKGPQFNYLLELEGANAVPGGIPIVSGGKVIGGIGCSGVTGAQDIQICEAGLAALK
ncbi:MAG: heme-binding protein [Pseudolabrys sp.]|jgi:glc operon protein GlcG